MRVVANWMDTKKVIIRRRQKREYSAPNSTRGFAGAAGVVVAGAGGLVVGRRGVSLSESG